MRIGNPARGWITILQLDELLKEFKEGKLDEKTLIEKIYENYERIRCVKPDTSALLKTICEMHSDNIPLYLKLYLAFQEYSIIRENPMASPKAVTAPQQ